MLDKTEKVLYNEDVFPHTTLKKKEDLIMTNAEAVKRHHAKLDEFKIRPYKDEGQKIREAASKAGKSVQSYILDAVRTQMEIDERKK